MPINNVTEARDAILDTFRTYWLANAPAPIPEIHYWDSKKDTPDGSVEWVRITVVHNDGNQSTLGGPGGSRYSKFGVLTVQIWTPYNDGMVRNDAFAQVAVDAFEGKSSDGGDSIDFRRVRSNEVGRDQDWFLTNVLAEFDYDNLK